MILLYNNQKLPHIVRQGIKICRFSGENENEQVHIAYIPLLQTSALQSHIFTWGNSVHL